MYYERLIKLTLAVMDRKHSDGVSRRDFLKHLSNTLLFATVYPYLPKQELDVGSNLDFQEQIIVNTDGKHLYIPDTNGSTILEDVNIRWENYWDSKVKTPDIAHGHLTFFGESAVSDAQFFIQTDQLRINMANGYSLTPNQQILVSLRDNYDNNSLFDVNESTEDYINNFHDWLLQSGYSGVIALKSPEDFGGIGRVQIWNPIAENWIGPFNVIVLNTATYETFQGRVDQVSQFPGTDIQFSWLGDVSKELLIESGINSDSESETAIVFRWVENTINPIINNNFENIVFPEIELLPTEINDATRVFGENFANIIRSIDPNFIIELFNDPKVADYDNTAVEFHYINNEYPFYGILWPQFISYMLNQVGVNNYFNRDTETFRLDIKDTNITEMAMPMGLYAQHIMLLNLFRNGVISRKLFYPPYRADDFSDINFGIFIIEEIPNPYYPVQTVNGGLVINFNDSLRFLYLDGVNQPANMDIITAKDRFLNSSNKRVAIYY